MLKRVREFFRKKNEKKIFYLLVGFDDDFIYEELVRELHQRRVGVTQLLKDESKAFSMWLKTQNKIPY
jgi:hypothetical protein